MGPELAPCGRVSVEKSRDSRERRASASSLALSHWARWRVAGEGAADGEEGTGPEGEVEGLWVVGSRPILRNRFLRWVFQKFLISLSVRPGNWKAIDDHLCINNASCRYNHQIVRSV